MVNVHDLYQSFKYRLMLPHVSPSAKPMLPPRSGAHTRLGREERQSSNPGGQWVVKREEHRAEKEHGVEEHVVGGKADYCCGEENVHNQSVDHSSVSSSLDL